MTPYDQVHTHSTNLPIGKPQTWRSSYNAQKTVLQFITNKMSSKRQIIAD